jgi:hypothetical protein
VATALQSPLQPSPSMVLPSSQASTPAYSRPSPQLARRQHDEQASV